MQGLLKSGVGMKKWLPIAIGVIVILAAAIGLWMLTSQPAVVVPPAFEVQYRECVDDLDNLGALVDALVSRDPADCASVTPRSMCEALVTGNKGGCQGERFCLAMIDKNPEQCDGDDAVCRAFASNDPSLCDAISFLDLADREQCKAIVSLDSEYFSSRQAQQDCADVVISVLNSEQSHCELIAHEEVKNYCQSAYRSS
ncbi:hypothetical protein GF342_04200 [Candidatus Woesearchaeota archaeon]|nr:hypothetical protein [Candidatus Woesearchaeota archaeon]